MIRSLLFAIFLGAFSSSMSQTPCINGMAGSYPCDKVDLLSHLSPNQIGGGEMSDIWGWTDEISGREFVMIGREAGTSFVEITNNLNPVFIGSLPSHTSSSFWRDIKVYDDHAFIVSEAGNHGMQVFELTQLLTATNLPVTFSESAHYSGFGKCHNIVINEESGFAYGVGSLTANGGLHVINISNPTSPVIAGLFSSDGYTHDAQAVIYNGPDTDYIGDEIVFACNEDDVAIINATDKTDIELITHATYPSPSYTHQGWLTEDHKYFIANDELDEYNNGGATRTFIFDVQDLDNPFLLGTHSHSSGAIDHNLYILGDYVYEANYRAGLRILNGVDIENGNLQESAYFDLYPSSNAPLFNGAWSSYPYFNSGVVAVSHIEDGLFLLKPDFTEYYADNDMDGFGDLSSSKLAFDQPIGYVLNSLDCDDQNELVYPNAPGTGEGIDNNCDEEIIGDELVPLCTGDLNMDQIIASADLSILISDFGCSIDCIGDLDSDGLTTILDLSLMLILYGTSCN